MPKKSIVICDTPDCDDEAKCAGLCTACYQWAYYHKNQGVAANQQYKKRVKRTASRVECHMADRKVSKSTNTRARSENRAYH